MMKKSLSILLICVLLLGMTAFATPSTKIYYSLNVDDYATISDFISSFTASGTTTSHSWDNANYVFEKSKEVQDFEGAAGGRYSAAKQNKYFQEGALSFGTNGLGRKTVFTAGSVVADKEGAGMAFIPAESWDFLEHQDEIFIISYDLEANTRDVANQVCYHSDQTYWTDDAKTQSFSVNVFQKVNERTKLTLRANCANVFSSGEKVASFDNGTTHRIAYGYSYGDGNLKTDTSVTPNEEFYVPTRMYFKDGGPWASNGTYSSTETYSGNGWKGRERIYAFTFNWYGMHGIEYSDIIAYTVSTDPTTFTAELVDDAVNAGDSVVVRFSQPIVPTTATKSSFTITENGSSFNNFEINDVRTYIDASTKEVGTEVEFAFPYGTNAGSTYEITMDTSVIKSEIMRTVASGNVLTFTTAAAPSNVISLSANSGLAGDGSAVTGITTTQAKFTATADSNDISSFLFIGIFDSSNNLVSYTYTKATTGDVLSLASKVEAGQTVKAFSCGNVYDLTQVFGTGADIQ